MRWLLWNVDWSLGNNRIHCSSGASLQATGLAHEMHGRRQLPQSGLVHEVIMSIAAHDSRAMPSRHFHGRIEAKRRALDEIAARQRTADEKRKGDAERQMQATATQLTAAGQESAPREPAVD